MSATRCIAVFFWCSGAHAQTEFALATAVWGSVYLLIGALYEERRLADRYGDAYVEYRRRVPAFIPWRGRVREE